MKGEVDRRDDRECNLRKGKDRRARYGKTPGDREIGKTFNFLSHLPKYTMALRSAHSDRVDIIYGERASSDCDITPDAHYRGLSRNAVDRR